MKRIAEFVCGVSALILVNACTTNLSLVDPAGFVGEIDGAQTNLYTLRSSELTMQVTNFGGRVVSLFVPDANGDAVDVTRTYYYKFKEFYGL